MDAVMLLAPEDLTDSILPSQYVDLIRRRSTLCEGEYRLLWAVLEDAVRTYLRSKTCSNRVQRERFEEVRDWLEQSPAGRPGLFAFRTLCDLLGIDAGRLLQGLRSRGASDIRPRRYRSVQTTGAVRAAA